MIDQNRRGVLALQYHCSTPVFMNAVDGRWMGAAADLRERVVVLGASSAVGVPPRRPAYLQDCLQSGTWDSAVSCEDLHAAIDQEVRPKLL